MTFDETKAEDLVGQAIVTGFQSWEQFDGQYPRSWMIQIMRNHWRSAMRKSSFKMETSLEDSIEISDENFWVPIETDLIKKEILTALDSLPEDYRLVVALCDIEELSYEEAAQSLDIPLGTIRSRLFRGRKILRSKLASLQDNQ